MTALMLVSEIVTFVFGAGVGIIIDAVRTNHLLRVSRQDARERAHR